MTIGLVASVAGQTYDLNTDKIKLLDWELGLSSVSRLSQRTPTQIGDTDLGFRLEPRFVPLLFGIHGDDVQDYRIQRGKILECFQPRIGTPVVLTFTLEGGITRAVQVYLDGELASTERVEFVEKIGGLFKASDPRLYNPETKTINFNLEGAGGSTSGFEIPWEIPWEIGTDSLNAVAEIEYAELSRLGAPEFPIITIFGPIEDPVITNETTGEVLDFSANGGLALSGTPNFAKINLSPQPFRDAKTVTDENGVSLASYLTTDSDLVSFHLAPAGEKLFDDSFCDGNNVIRVTGSGVTAETVVVMTYLDRYQGV